MCVRACALRLHLVACLSFVYRGVGVDSGMNERRTRMYVYVYVAMCMLCWLGLYVFMRMCGINACGTSIGLCMYT